MENLLVVFCRYPGSCFSLCGVTNVDVLYSQNFEQNADGWAEVTTGNLVTQVGGFSPTFNGTGGVGQLTMVQPYAGPFSRFRPTGTDPVNIVMDTTPNGIVLQLAFYLDVSANNGLTDGQLVDYSVALNMASGAFVRDYVFNFGFYDDGTGPGANTRRFVVSTSNNAASSTSTANPKNANNDPISIDQSGWYIYRHEFYPMGQDVYAQLSIFDANCVEKKAWAPQQVTISGDGDRPMTTSDTFYTRYGWVVINQLPSNSLKIDGQVYGKPLA